MSRVANSPITIPSSVTVRITDNEVSIKGGKGEFNYLVRKDIEVKTDRNTVRIKPRSGKKSEAMVAGTTRALINNMVTGVNIGFEKQLELVGVGYRAQVKGSVLNLTLGFSHPVEHKIPDGISIETPSQTQIFVKGCDKQKVCQVAADIRNYRPPEPYKGKGIRYTDEFVARKEAKKK